MDGDVVVVVVRSDWSSRTMTRRPLGYTRTGRSELIRPARPSRTTGTPRVVLGRGGVSAVSVFDGGIQELLASTVNDMVRV